MKCRIEISDGITKLVRDSQGRIIRTEWNIVKTFLGSITKTNGYPKYRVCFGDDIKFRVNRHELNNFISIPNEEYRNEYVRVIALK